MIKTFKHKNEGIKYYLPYLLPMKQINEAFEDKEHELIRKAKEKSGLTWHDFLLESAKKW